MDNVFALKAGVGAFFTVTLQTYFLLLTAAVIFALPALTPFTTPFAFTVAMLLLLVDHVTLALVLFIFSVEVFPTYMDNVFALKAGAAAAFTGMLKRTVLISINNARRMLIIFKFVFLIFFPPLF